MINLNKLFVNIWFLVYYRHFLCDYFISTVRIYQKIDENPWKCVKHLIFTCTHLISACTMVKIGKILQNFTWKTFTSPKIWHERVSFYNRNSKILHERGFRRNDDACRTLRSQNPSSSFWKSDRRRCQSPAAGI